MPLPRHMVLSTSCDGVTIEAASADKLVTHKDGPLNEGDGYPSPPWKQLQQISRVESPTCTPTIALSAVDWRPGRPSASAEPPSVPPLVPPLAARQSPAAPESPQVEVPTANDWVPLSVRQAQAREKEEEAARERKMAKMVAPVTIDRDTGLPCIPERCLPIKLYQRFLDASAARAHAVEQRRGAARRLANKVMAALAATSAPKTFENYCEQLAALSVGSGEHAAANAGVAGEEGGSAVVSGDQLGARAKLMDDGTNDLPAPMLKRVNSWELLSNSEDSC
jgi:hypothetical protein